MVIRTPDIDSPIKSTVKLVLVICNVGSKICGLSVITYNHPILFIPEVVRLEPECPILFIDHALTAKIIDDLFHFTGFKKALFAKPVVVRYAERFQVFFNVFQYMLCRISGTKAYGFRFIQI